MKQSPLFRLNCQDALKALVIAMLTPVLVVVQSSIDAGQLTFDWKHMGMAAIGGGVAYLIKNFLTPATTNANNTTPPAGA